MRTQRRGCPVNSRAHARVRSKVEVADQPHAVRVDGQAGFADDRSCGVVGHANQVGRGVGRLTDGEVDRVRRERLLVEGHPAQRLQPAGAAEKTEGNR